MFQNICEGTTYTDKNICNFSLSLQTLFAQQTNQ